MKRHYWRYLSGRLFALVKTVLHYGFDKLLPIVVGAFIFAGVLGSYNHHAQNIELMSNGFYPQYPVQVLHCDRLYKQFIDKSRYNLVQLSNMLNQFEKAQNTNINGQVTHLQQQHALLQKGYESLLAVHSLRDAVYDCQDHIMHHFIVSSALMGPQQHQTIVQRINKINTQELSLAPLFSGKVKHDSIHINVPSQAMSLVQAIEYLKFIRKMMFLTAYQADKSVSLTRQVEAQMYGYLANALSQRINQNFFAYLWAEFKALF